MTRDSIWAARGALALVTTFGGFAVVDLQHRFAQIPLPGDRYLHGGLSYALTLALAPAFPTIAPWRLALGVLAAGGGLEVLQGFGLLGGDAEILDLVVDGVGILLALCPLLIGGALRAQEDLQLLRSAAPRGRGMDMGGEQAYSARCKGRADSEEPLEINR